MTTLPLVPNIRLTNKRSFPTWYAELRINALFRNIWHLADLDALMAPHLLSVEPPKPLSINQMIKQLNIKRNIPLELWD
jgi:hypothetical protein